MTHLWQRFEFGRGDKQRGPARAGRERAAIQAREAESGVSHIGDGTDERSMGGVIEVDVSPFGSGYVTDVKWWTHRRPGLGSVLVLTPSGIGYHRLKAKRVKPSPLQSDDKQGGRNESHSRNNA
jgi:hypothetical protein